MISQWVCFVLWWWWYLTCLELPKPYSSASWWASSFPPWCNCTKRWFVRIPSSVAPVMRSNAVNTRRTAAVQHFTASSISVLLSDLMFVWNKNEFQKGFFSGFISSSCGLLRLEKSRNVGRALREVRWGEVGARGTQSTFLSSSAFIYNSAAWTCGFSLTWRSAAWWPIALQWAWPRMIVSPPVSSACYKKPLSAPWRIPQ